MPMTPDLIPGLDRAASHRRPTSSAWPNIWPNIRPSLAVQGSAQQPRSHMDFKCAVPHRALRMPWTAVFQIRSSRSCFSIVGFPQCRYRECG
jgi:hypothetical protein